uniref:Uncharacterized protein n=1 Tax=Rhizophora mucronata TaxID=61149 RepID=A0A2P2IMS2_RHIMU
MFEVLFWVSLPMPGGPTSHITCAHTHTHAHAYAYMLSSC